MRLSATTVDSPSSTKMMRLLKTLAPQDIYDPEDLNGLKRLDAIPGMKKFLAETISNLREKFTSIEMYGDGINITKEGYPELHDLLVAVAKTLGNCNVPDFSMTWGYDISMGTEGAKSPRITALSGAIDLLDEDGLRFLIGHEIGHIMAGHKPYHNVLITFYTPLMKMVPNAEIWLSLLRPLLLQWFRTSDYTADRAGLLACQDMNVALKTMVKMSGIPKKYYDTINTESFLRQAVEFDRNNQGIAEGLIQNLSINTACVPWMVVRAARLYQWYKSGAYTEIINKNAI